MKKYALIKITNGNEEILSESNNLSYINRKMGNEWEKELEKAKKADPGIGRSYFVGSSATIDGVCRWEIRENSTADSIIEEYERDSEVVMAEFLAWKKVPRGMSFEQAFETYIECMKKVEGDKFFTIKEGKKIEL